MQLLINDEVAGQFLAMAKKNPKIVQSIAEQYLRHVDTAAILRYLVDRDTALKLLCERFAANPEGTLAELRRLPAAGSARTGGGRGQRAGRRRLSEGEAEQLKDSVRSFLRENPWSSRKAILANVPIPSAGLYNRIMAELREGKQIRSKGSRAKTLYALSSARG